MHRDLTVGKALQEGDHVEQASLSPSGRSGALMWREALCSTAWTMPAPSDSSHTHIDAREAVLIKDLTEADKHVSARPEPWRTHR